MKSLQLERLLAPLVDLATLHGAVYFCVGLGAVQMKRVKGIIDRPPSTPRHLVPGGPKGDSIQTAVRGDVALLMRIALPGEISACEGGGLAFHDKLVYEPHPC